MPIYRLLLSWLGFHDKRVVVKNEDWEKSAFTWNQIKHVIVVPESEIGRNSPSILLHRQATAQTSCLSALLLLAEDKSFENIEGVKEREQRRAVTEFIQVRLGQLQERSSHIETAIKQLQKTGKSIKGYIAELRDSLHALELERARLANDDAETVKEILKDQKQKEINSVLITQRETLIGQYNADISRLDLQIQGMRLDRQHPIPGECQFCHSKINVAPPTDEEIAARKEEIQSRRTLLAGAEEDLETIRNRIRVIDDHLSEARQRHASAINRINEFLGPSINKTKSLLDNFSRLTRLSTEYEELKRQQLEYHKYLEDNTAKHLPIPQKYRPRDYFGNTFYEEIEKTAYALLSQAHYRGLHAVEFDPKKFDLRINDQDAENTLGKGYRAFSNTALILAFHSYLDQHSRHAPGFVLIDSPLYGFDEGGAENTDETMRFGMLSCLEKFAEEQQVIIIENENNVSGFKFDQKDNLIKFTHHTSGQENLNSQTRYGFLEGVTDETENA